MRFFSLFPAYAGVIPTPYFLDWNTTAFPRIRGGDPILHGKTRLEVVFSPHTRG